MSFADTLAEARERFSESLQLLNMLDAADQVREGAASNIDKALKGLVLVSIYAALERSVNSVVEQAISVISSHASPSSACNPAVISIFHFGRIQALRNCGGENILNNASNLIASAMSRNPISTQSNPLLLQLQNVDAEIMLAVAKSFGIAGYSILPEVSGRLNNLRERRNAISHGREAASAAGERFTMPELRKVYSMADSEVTRFIETFRVHCETRRYLVGAA